MYKLIRPILFLFDPEKMHDNVHYLGQLFSFPPFSSLVARLFSFNDLSLQTQVAGIAFNSPVGLAAGFDKNAEMMQLMKCLGFGFLEIGSVTARATKGNPKPRLFRLVQDHAIINRMGLGNDGVEQICGRLKSTTINIPIGVNIAKTNDSWISGDRAIEDYLTSFEAVSALCDYITLNISCPNTVDGKTFEEVETLAQLLSSIQNRAKQKNIQKPVFIKISPDLPYDKLNGIAEIAQRYEINGYVLCNTSLDRTMLRTERTFLASIGNGGVSGAPIKQKGTDLIRYMYKNFNRPDIIGVGGIFTPEDAYEKIKAGASLVQLYTSLIYEGPSVVKKINRGLARLLKRDGFTSMKQAVGCEAV